VLSSNSRFWELFDRAASTNKWTALGDSPCSAADPPVQIFGAYYFFAATAFLISFADFAASASFSNPTTAA
jgi:hypothetical protein